VSPREAILCCSTCGQVQRVSTLNPGTAAVCCRCGSVVEERKLGSLHFTAALSLAALIFYVPANIYPILHMTIYGAHSENTAWQGAMSLIQHNQIFVGIIVLLASIVVPFLKLLGLLFLTLSAKARWTRWRKERTAILHFIDVIGPWAMLDVFLLAVLVSLVKLGQIATVVPGPGLLAFTCVVVLTILATMSFDPKLIWEGAESCDDR
jgi:paraquat-inducible protein A